MPVSLVDGNREINEQTDSTNKSISVVVRNSIKQLEKAWKNVLTITQIHTILEQSFHKSVFDFFCKEKHEL